MSADRIQRVLLEMLSARSVVVHLDKVIDEVMGRADYPAPVQELLSEALLVAAMCSSGIKFNGRISLQLRSGGALRLLLADCTDDGGLRGIARLGAEAIAPDSGFADLTGGGVLTFTLEPADRGNVWQGIVPLEGAGLADAVTGYFEQSEQLPSLVRLAVADGRAAGLMVQRLPGAGDQALPEKDDEGWRHLQHLMATVSDRELLETDGETLLHRLFHAERRRLFPSRPLRFHCPCSRERVANMLRGLGPEELQDMIQSQSEVEVSCEFCNQRYGFDRVDLEGLIAGDAPTAPGGDTVH